MKKVLSLILALVLCLSLCACGGDTANTNKTDAPNKTENGKPQLEETKTYSIGETVGTNKAQFTLNSCEFASVLLANYDDDYLTPTTADAIETGDKFNVPDDGKVFLSFAFTIENIGKTKLDNFIKNDKGSTNFLYGYITIEYDDGYIFGGDKETAIYKRSGDSWPIGQMNIDVMAPANEYRGYLEVPMEVMTSSDKPLFFVIQLPNESGEFETFTFKIR